MGFLKGLTLAIISILLFLSLFLVGAGLTFNFTALNPGFVNGQIEKLNIAGLVKETVTESSSANDMPRALRDFVDNELPAYSEELKAATSTAVDRFYDYILGRIDTLDLKVALGETVLAPELIYSLADKINWPVFADELVRRDIASNIDPAFSYLIDYIDDATIKLEPWFKATLREVVPPVHDYLLGQSQTLDVSIPLDEPAVVLYSTLLDVFNRFPPPELAGLTPAQRQIAFNGFFFFQLIPSLPAAIEINSASFAGAPESLNKAFNDLKVEVDRLKDYTTYYWMAFYGLIAIIAVLVGLAYLTMRRLKKLLLFSGIIFFVFGLLGFVAVMVTNSVITTGTDFGAVPAAVQVWIPGVVESALRPFLIFSIGVGTMGIAGIIGSILMHPHPTPAR
jgi:hypothetical protein